MAATIDRSVSETSICNNALIRIGEQPIVSLQDTSNRAILCLRLWPHVRDAELRNSNWNSCVARAQLNALSASPIAGFQFAYPLPSDYLFLVEILIVDAESPYHIENGQLLTDLPGPLFIRYIQASQNPNGWDTLLIDTLSWRMASELAIPLTGSTAIYDRMLQRYQASLQAARTRDGQEDYPESLLSWDLIDVRM